MIFEIIGMVTVAVLCLLGLFGLIEAWLRW